MSAARGLDAAMFRRLFPGLESQVYLASCSLGAVSTRLVEAVVGVLGEVHGQRPAWEAFEAEVERLRHGVAALIGAHPDQVALLPNASVAAFQVASSLSWEHRPRLVTTAAEFPSLAHLWLAQASRGARVHFVGAEGAIASGADFESVIDRHTGLVSVPMTTYRDAVRLPVAQIAGAAHAAGALVVVDAYQAAGVEPVDVNALDCDFLITGFGKYLLGMPGVVALYARHPTAGTSRPQLTGWFGRRDPFAFNPRLLDFPDQARRFETGTPAVQAVYAANAGLSLIGELDLAAVRLHVARLVDRIADLLTAQGRPMRVADDPAARGAHAAMAHDDPAGLAAWLARRGVVISPRGPVARLSVHAYTSHGDVEAACALIHEYERAGRPVGATAP